MLNRASVQEHFSGSQQLRLRNCFQAYQPSCLSSNLRCFRYSLLQRKDRTPPHPYPAVLPSSRVVSRHGSLKPSGIARAGNSETMIEGAGFPTFLLLEMRGTRLKFMDGRGSGPPICTIPVLSSFRTSRGPRVERSAPRKMRVPTYVLPRRDRGWRRCEHTFEVCCAIILQPGPPLPHKGEEEEYANQETYP